MTFSEVIWLVTGLLFYEKRVSYRRLSVEFGLDADMLANLRQELAVKRLAVDEDGEGLAWVGDAETTVATRSEVPAPERLNPRKEQSLPPVPSGSASPSRTERQEAPKSPDAERRQLTVMFCDLVGSTALSTKMDPEDLRDVITSFQDECREAIKRYDGFIARYMGDGMLVYFGYPRAHENDAERATRAGLDIVGSMATLNAQVGKTHGVVLAVRVGVATGPVIVGDLIGEGAAEEAAVVGETPNLAARLQGVALPNQLVISAATHHIVGDLFTFDDLGTHELKGIAEPTRVWRVAGAADIESRHETRRQTGSSPLVGRQEELGLLNRSREASKDGQGHVVLIQGAPGVGKSRLLEALREPLADDDYVWVSIRCSPYHASSTLYPVIEHFKRVMGWQPEDDDLSRLEKLEAALGAQSVPLAEVVPLFAQLMSVPLPADRYAALAMTPMQQRAATLDAIAGWGLHVAENKMVLQVWEDLHWADPTTLELLGLFIDQSHTVSMLNVLTYRPEFVPPWPMRSHMTPITLNRLERAEVEAFVNNLTGGKSLPPEVLEHIVSKADGVPLYVEELTKAIIGSGVLVEEADAYVLDGTLAELQIPSTLQDSLMARLDRAPTLREVAQLGSVLGREFAYEMLQALAEVEEPTLQAVLGQLVDAELLYQRGRPPNARYIFKHALVQDAAYQSLLRRTRHQYHERVATMLEGRLGEPGEVEPELLAYHYAGAGLAVQAIEHWLKAARRAAKRSAYMEAFVHLQEGSEQLERVPPGDERTHLALRLQIERATALLSTKGMSAPDTGEAFNIARDLCSQLGEEVDEVFPALWGIFTFHNVRSEYSRSHEVASDALRRAEILGDPAILVLAHRMMGPPLVQRGELEGARRHLEAVRALYDPLRDHESASRFGVDLLAGGVAFLSQTMFVLGHPDQALSLALEAVRHAESLAHPTSICFALNWLALVHCLRREPEATLEHADRAMTLSREHGLTQWLVSAKARYGHALIELGEIEKGIAAVGEALDEFRAMDSRLYRPFNVAAMAIGAARSGATGEAMQFIDEALDETEQTSERWSEAEIQRLKGGLELSRTGPEAQARAEQCFLRSLEVARSQGARAWELRTATDLARLWHEQGKSDDARDLLVPAYHWFGEGFATADLKAARLLLDELQALEADAVAP